MNYPKSQLAAIREAKRLQRLQEEMRADLQQKAAAAEAQRERVRAARRDEKMKKNEKETQTQTQHPPLPEQQPGSEEGEVAAAAERKWVELAQARKDQRREQRANA